MLLLAYTIESHYGCGDDNSNQSAPQVADRGKAIRYNG